VPVPLLEFGVLRPEPVVPGSGATAAPLLPSEGSAEFG
jgi:hypothetical protein